MSKQLLKDQSAIVTGANSGIGKAVALALGRAGANVVVNYVTKPEDAQAVVAQIEQEGSKAIAIEADVSNEQQVKDLFAGAIGRFGTVHILVNNAGLQRDSPIAEMTLEQWNTVIGINLTGQFLCSREAVKEFRRRGMQPLSTALGKIICMSSVHESIPWTGHANYAASKGGVRMLMKTMAQELAAEHIRVNAVAPGAIETPINRSAWETEAARNELLKLIPSGRVGVPADIGNVCVWLSSDDSDYITGTSIAVDGGMLLYPGFRTGG
jgi:glucose 1-dehydrogenase